MLGVDCPHHFPLDLPIQREQMKDATRGDAL